jgi:hypothetical protein
LLTGPQKGKELEEEWAPVEKVSEWGWDWVWGCSRVGVQDSDHTWEPRFPDGTLGPEAIRFLQHRRESPRSEDILV